MGPSNTGLAALIILSLCAIAGCGGGDDATPTTSVQPSNQTAIYSAQIGPEGGTLAVEDQASELYGAKVIIPAGALSAAQEITITLGHGTGYLPSSYTISGNSVEFEPAGLIFQDQVTVVLPYRDHDNDGFIDDTAIAESEVGAMFADPANGELEIFQVLERNSTENQVTIQTNHFSTYLTYVGPANDSTTTGPAPTTTTFLPGEHLTGNPVFAYDPEGNQTLLVLEAPYYHLTIQAWQDGQVSTVDRFLTTSKTGLACIMADDYTSCTFDAAEMFFKVAQSGNAALWDWQCNFVPEHTLLQNYEVGADTLQNDASAGGIYCEMEAVDETTARITWGVDARIEVYNYTSGAGLGDMLAIRLWANYR